MKPTTITRNELNRIKLEATFCPADEAVRQCGALVEHLGWCRWSLVQRCYLEFTMAADVVQRLGGALRALFGLPARPRITRSVRPVGDMFVVVHVFRIPVNAPADGRSISATALQVLKLVRLVLDDEVVVTGSLSQPIT